MLAVVVVGQPCMITYSSLFVLKLFFFFMQKTAEELRISDRSSDECSADLPFSRMKRSFNALLYLSAIPIYSWNLSYFAVISLLVDRHFSDPSINMICKSLTRAASIS